MGRAKFVFKQKIIKISQEQQRLMDEILITGAFTIEAEVFRQGLALMHKKFTTPEYLKPTINQEIKMDKIKKEKLFRAIPDEQFVKDNIEDVLIFTDEDNKKFVLFHAVGNYIGAVPLETVKDWVKSKDPTYNFHVEKANADPNWNYEKELQDPGIKKVLVERFGVALTL